ncbi:hypothetical protein [Methylobacterium sp. ID0610]|uniref:hypothetical protein n=1 Tax=Methylobacterium carpenticola TaxID=3344827 RepID=UPI0036A76933
MSIDPFRCVRAVEIRRRGGPIDDDRGHPQGHQLRFAENSFPKCTFAGPAAGALSCNTRRCLAEARMVLFYAFAAWLGGLLTAVGLWEPAGPLIALAAAPFGASGLTVVAALWVYCRRAPGRPTHPEPAAPPVGQHLVRDPQLCRTRATAS